MNKLLCKRVGMDEIMEITYNKDNKIVYVTDQNTTLIVKVKYNENGDISRLANGSTVKEFTYNEYNHLVKVVTIKEDKEDIYLITRVYEDGKLVSCVDNLRMSMNLVSTDREDVYYITDRLLKNGNIRISVNRDEQGRKIETKRTNGHITRMISSFYSKEDGNLIANRYINDSYISNTKYEVIFDTNGLPIHSRDLNTSEEGIMEYNEKGILIEEHSSMRGDKIDYSFNEDTMTSVKCTENIYKKMSEVKKYDNRYNLRSIETTNTYRTMYLSGDKSDIIKYEIYGYTEDMKGTEPLVDLRNLLEYSYGLTKELEFDVLVGNK